MNYNSESHKQYYLFTRNDIADTDIDSVVAPSTSTMSAQERRQIFSKTGHKNRFLTEERLPPSRPHRSSLKTNPKLSSTSQYQNSVKTKQDLPSSSPYRSSIKTPQSVPSTSSYQNSIRKTSRQRSTSPYESSISYERSSSISVVPVQGSRSKLTSCFSCFKCCAEDDATTVIEFEQKDPKHIRFSPDTKTFNGNSHGGKLPKRRKSRVEDRKLRHELEYTDVAVPPRRKRLPQIPMNATHQLYYAQNTSAKKFIKKMSPISEKERKIILEFCHLLEKSKQLFNGLRELTPYGNKQWQAHFGRTFDIYAKLWKFQQQFRPVLDQRYGLKRWQIGEIASKIGQLYYHFYLRTSEIAYLVEAFSFYLAIRGRQYYNLASKEAKSELMVKKLRYYARFIVVAILLRQSEIINDLLLELEKQIVAYGQAYDPNDQAEWLNVLEEVRAFLNADPGVSIIDQENNNRIVTLSGRLSRHTIPAIERTLQMNLKLQDAIIIGSGTQLVKFSELTIDMFRMLQNLEWEIDVPIKDPSVDSPHASGGTSKTPKRIGVQCVDGNVNPHKYLLFKPSACQVVTYVASTVNELPKKGVLLIFISADGYHPHQNTHPENYTYDIGGLITSSKSDIYRDYNRETKAGSSKYKNKHILYPGDLQPFTRKPLVLIVDSDNSYAFQHISRTFGLPLLVLMSPLSLPATINDRSSQGSLFTLFLHNPIAGLCNSCDIFTISLETWDKCSHLREVFMKEAVHLLMRTRVDLTYHAFLGCEFLRLLILRYIFCECTLRLHREFRARTNLPRASPPLPDELMENCDLMSIIFDIADCIGVREYFYDPSGPGNTPRD